MLMRVLEKNIMALLNWNIVQQDAARPNAARM
jgi:hypothetical protein